MARKPRIHFSGAVYHIVLKGFDDKAVFHGIKDRRAWEALVAEGCQRFGHKLHAYCWMKDHMQIAVEVEDAPLSKIMQNLSFRYTRYFNKHNHDEGALFRGRYKAVLIDPDVYLQELVRFIHNNPVRSGVARFARDYKWSSHTAYLGKDQTEWLTTGRVLNTFGKTKTGAVQSFEKYVNAGRDEGDRQDLMRGTNGGRLLGDEQFAKKALKPPRVIVRPMSLSQLVKLVCREEGIKESAIKSASRARLESRIRQTIAYLAMELNIASLTSLATRFNRDLTTMSRNQRYFRDRLLDDAELQKRVKQLRKQVVEN